jgi:Ca2+-binding RTX toxin-like protein
VFIYVTQGVARIDATKFIGVLHLQVLGAAVADVVYGTSLFTGEQFADTGTGARLGSIAKPGATDLPSSFTTTYIKPLPRSPVSPGPLKRSLEEEEAPPEDTLSVVSTSTWTKIGSGADAQIMRDISVYAKWDPDSMETNGYWNSAPFLIDNAYDYGSLSQARIGLLGEGDSVSYSFLSNWINPFQMDDPDHVFTGSFDDDRIEGTDDIDTLVGKDGKDTYVVNHKLDYVDEAVDGGNDKALVSTDWYMSANVEQVEVVGTVGRNIQGNDSDNVIQGNIGNDTMAGGGGADELRGGQGSDTYEVDAQDTVVELSDQGNDTIQTRIDGYSLANVQNVENLTLIGNAAINGSGDQFDNVLTGNGAANHLKGDAGKDIDTMIGGTGDDHYVVDYGRPTRSPATALPTR